MDNSRACDAVAAIIAPIDTLSRKLPPGGRVQIEIEIPGRQFCGRHFRLSALQLPCQQSPVGRQDLIYPSQFFFLRPPPLVVIVGAASVAAEFFVYAPVQGGAALGTTSLHLFFATKITRRQPEKKLGEEIYAFSTNSGKNRFCTRRFVPCLSVSIRFAAGSAVFHPFTLQVKP